MPRLTGPSKRAIRAELSRLGDSATLLPGPIDFEALLSPPAVGVAWARQVQDATSVWILYRLAGDVVSQREVTDREPVRVD